MLNILSHKKNNHKRFFSSPLTVVLLRLLFTPVSITPLIDTEDACFDLNASRPIAKGDLKWRDALLVAHRVNSNLFKSLFTFVSITLLIDTEDACFALNAACLLTIHKPVPE